MSFVVCLPNTNTRDDVRAALFKKTRNYYSLPGTTNDQRSRAKLASNASNSSSHRYKTLRPALSRTRKQQTNCIRACPHLKKNQRNPDARVFHRHLCLPTFSHTHSSRTNQTGLPHAALNLRASRISFCWIVTRLAWIAHRFASWKRLIKKASVASCNAMMAWDCQRLGPSSVVSLWAISRTYFGVISIRPILGSK